MKINTFYGKLIGGTIALLLVSITVPSPIAQAATLAELQTQIQSLLTQINALQNQLRLMQGGVTVCTTPPSYVAFGESGTQVTQLQQFLMSRGYNIPAGATGYFGSQTQNALRQFQAAQGIIPALGYNYGPQTQARAKNICAAVVVTPTPTPQPTPTPTEPLSGEASLDRFSVNNGNDTDLQEGDKNKEVMEVSFRVTDGDVKINRIDLGFTPDSMNDEKDPWDTFGTISIWAGSKKITEVDGSRRQNWREDSPSNNDYLLRLSGFTWVVRENTEANLTIKATVQNSVRGTNDGEFWNIFIPDNGIRGLDADNAVVYTGDTADSISLNIDRAGSTDEIIIRRSDTDPDASSLQVKDDSRSGYLEVFAFDIDTDDSRNDIEIRELPIQLSFSSGTLNDFVQEARLVVDGKTYTREIMTDGAIGTITFDFDRNELIIDAGDRVTAVVEIDFKALPSTYEGVMVTGSVSASDIVAEGSDTLTGSQLSSSATGETHSLYTRGASVTVENTSAEVTSTSGSNNDYVTFSMTVTISAFGQDVYIPTGTNGVSYKLVDASGSALTASGTAVVTSSARELGSYFRITEGNSETLTLDVTYLPGVPNTTARLQLISINFNDAAQAPDQTWLALPTSSYRTPVKVIVD